MVKKFLASLNKKGFTLSELLIVVSLIGILGTTGFIGYKTQIAKGFDKRRKDDLSRLKIAFEDYYNDHNCYPPTTFFSSCGEAATQLTPYLRIIPCDPKTNQSYTLVTQNRDCPQWFKIYSILDNKADSIINNLGCGGGCGPNGPAKVSDESGQRTLTEEEVDYSYNYGVSSSDVSVGCDSQYYSGWAVATPELVCNIKSNNGTPPNCNPYFCGSNTCRLPMEECK